MNKFIPRLLISALSLGVADYLVPGIYTDGITTLLIAAFLLGIVNAVLKPILFILTLPLTILTFGVFLLILNALMLALVAFILPGFAIHSLGSAFWGWLILSVVSWIANKIFEDPSDRA